MQKINQEKVLIEKSVEDWKKLQSKLEDAEILVEMSEAGDEDSFTELKTEVKFMSKMADDLELKSLLSGEMDGNNCILTINSGAGGTEACDWASMLMRMYVRYAESQSFQTEILDISEGEEAGIKSCTIGISGPYAFGNLKAENGVHRLVRVSPFDSNARRHTSFASVFVWPEVDDNIEVEVKTEDLKVDTYRASGAGGQHINKTDSAVRITHIPSGIVVQCQNQRSQHANRDRAMKMLKAALYEKELEARQKEKDKMNAEKKENEWGSQIRSYVLHPYKMVKDHRTSHESGAPQNVLDGDLDGFIESYLRMQANQGAT